jgi:heme/copper-type cytochrome/quinol oxidase subunit 2
MSVRRFDLAAFLLFQLVGGVALFMLFWVMFDATVSGFFETAITEGSAERAQGATWLEYAWTFGPAIVLTMLALKVLSRAVFESQGGVGRR